MSDAFQQTDSDYCLSELVTMLFLKISFLCSHTVLIRFQSEMFYKGGSCDGNVFPVALCISAALTVMDCS